MVIDFSCYFCEDLGDQAAASLYSRKLIKPIVCCLGRHALLHQPVRSCLTPDQNLNERVSHAKSQEREEYGQRNPIMSVGAEGFSKTIVFNSSHLLYFLISQNCSAILTSHPGTRTPSASDPDVTCDLLLLIAARHNLVARQVRPLAVGETFCSRFRASFVRSSIHACACLCLALKPGFSASLSWYSSRDLINKHHPLQHRFRTRWWH